MQPFLKETLNQKIEVLIVSCKSSLSLEIKKDSIDKLKLIALKPFIGKRDKLFEYDRGQRSLHNM